MPALAAGATRTRRCRRSPTSSASSTASARSASGSAPSTCAPTRSWPRSRRARDKLIAERDDLTEAIRKLRGAIGSLNQEGRERLIAAFDVVNGHFKSLFSTLFEGGEAELLLVESDDPLEAGLELLARPPGKKPQTLTLLSGGEQALTAMSLIFAVFLTNPSPICVLDEVDAPLDDYNVERFCDLLEEMRKRADTRFVTITHNPITMARMDRLFGVTMAERGVSQIVSVELARRSGCWRRGKVARAGPRCGGVEPRPIPGNRDINRDFPALRPIRAQSALESPVIPGGSRQIPCAVEQGGFSPSREAKVPARPITGTTRADALGCVSAPGRSKNGLND